MLYLYKSYIWKPFSVNNKRHQRTPNFLLWTPHMHPTGAEPVDVGLVTVIHGFLVALWFACEQYLYSPQADRKEVKQMCRSLGFSDLGLGMSCRREAKESEFQKLRHLVLSILSPCTLLLPSPIYLWSSSRATPHLTWYILLGQWNKEVCLQPGPDGDRALDVFLGQPPRSPWRCCSCFRDVLTDTKGSLLTVWRIIPASLDTNAKNMHRVEKQPWPLAEWYSLVLRK